MARLAHFEEIKWPAAIALFTLTRSAVGVECIYPLDINGFLHRAARVFAEPGLFLFICSFCHFSGFLLASRCQQLLAT